MAKMMVATVFLTLSALACGPQVQDTTYVISSDPVLRAQVSELLPDLAARARMELVRPVRVERRSREHLESYLLFKLDQDLPPAKARNLGRTYSLLGLIPDTLDLRDLLVSIYMEQVAGFYDPDSTALFILDDMDEANVHGVLVHELVHAVQDQTANLDSLTAEERGNDRQAAAQSAIEGQATLVMFEYMLEQMRGEPVDLSELPDLNVMLRPALEAMRTQYPALASAPRILQEALLFPYLDGYSFVLALWQNREGRPAPFGPLLPQSTEQVMDPSRVLGEVDPPTEVELTPGSGYERLYDNVLGQAELKVLLEQHLGPEGPPLAQGWDGDRHMLLRTPDGSEGLVWASVWDSEAERDRFVQGFTQALESLESPATLMAVDVSGRPGCLLRIGIPVDTPVDIRVGPGNESDFPEAPGEGDGRVS
jgi:hypothetical protein